MQKFLYADHLTFAYENNVEPLFDSVSFQLQQGWTGLVGSNGSGKTTLLKLLCGILQPDSGNINSQGVAYYCEQRTDFIPSGFKTFLQASDKDAFRLKKALDIRNDWLNLWQKLSHGERKRCQIASALYLNPFILAIDEPSNHLDRASKKVLFNALKKFHGIGILVSHDRELLDDLCSHTLFLYEKGIDMRRSNYSTAFGEIEKEKSAQQHDYETAKREIKKLKRQLVRQMEKTSQTDKMGSKRGLNPRDHDARSKIDAARLTGKDAIAGQQYKKIQNQLERKEKNKAKIGFDKKQSLGISFYEKRAQKYFPLTIQSDNLTLGEDRILTIPDLLIQYGEKIGIIGENGSGKSSFINYFVNSINISPDEIIYIPQEIPVEQSKSILNRIHNYNNEKKGYLMTLISRLASDAEHVLNTTIPSPGEVRKLLLAEGILLNPALIIMDEPTNHMDLPSIECVEQALKECNCTQLLVSHDFEFLKNIVNYYWVFETNQDNGYRINVQTGL